MEDEGKTTEDEGKTTETEGRWLIVQNLTVNPRDFTHPARDAREDEHLHLGSFESKVISEEWYDSYAFMDKVQTEDNPDGYLRLYRSNQAPDNPFAIGAIVDELVGGGLQRPMALNAYYVCAMDPIPEEYMAIISLEPTTASKQRFGETSLTSQWDTVRDHLPWLRIVRNLETRWRNREPLLHILNERIEELEQKR